MQGAAEGAASLANPTVTHTDSRHATLRFDLGTQHAVRAVARADEAVRHLDRTVEYASAGVTHSLGHADAIANAAHQRLRRGQQNSTPMLGPSNPSGPPR